MNKECLHLEQINKTKKTQHEDNTVDHLTR